MSLVWLRQDLRLHDQPALVAAATEGAVVPVYVLDDESPRHRAMGGASRWWLHHSLASLDADLRARGSRLILRRGASDAVLADLARACGTRRVHAIRHAEPWWRNAERALGKSLDLVLHDGNHLAPLGSVTTGSGGAYRVYSAFWRALAERMPPAAEFAVPDAIPAPDRWPASDALDSWELLPRSPDWATGFDWQPGEAGARAKVQRFRGRVPDYAERRDLPSEEGTSRLSPHLHFGELSPRSLWHAVEGARDSAKFLKELAWRDFAAGLILALPRYGSENGRAAYDALRWRTGSEAEADLRAWQRGETGYPIVDAGMRQLWTTGWMHNRVRMIAASFLVKHLLIDWREGERWFWDTLVDADHANNAVNWQWVAGTGVDSNQWSRIMAPLLQSEKFAAGDYIRRWVPELAALPDSAIHDPDAAGVRPHGYPAKRIGHRAARERALAAGRSLGA